MGRLDGKVAVITGSTRGLGLAIAQAYAREGAAVVVSSRLAEAVQGVVTDLRQQGRRAAGLSIDVCDLEQVKALALFARESFGSIDIWVNNAGIADVFGPTAAIDPTRYTQVLQTNIFGTYHGSLVALDMFLAQGASGKLINILGRGDRGVAPYQSAYGSSKSWIRSFTLTLAKEYANTNLGIFAFNPGLMDTDLIRKVEVIQGYAEKLSGFRTIIRMWADPPTVPAEKALWLASAATDGKTGKEIRMLGFSRILGGLVREQSRKLLGRSAPESEMSLTTVEPHTWL